MPVKIILDMSGATEEEIKQFAETGVVHPASREGVNTLAMVKGASEDGGVELYDMIAESFFTVSAEEYTKIRARFIPLDEMDRVTQPEKWERDLEMRRKSRQACGFN